MNEYKEIDNTKYIISRVFAENKTKAMLIEQKILGEKNSISALTNGDGMMYNNSSGSIQSKEVL